MADVTWKDLVKLLSTLHAQVQVAPAPPNLTEAGIASVEKQRVTALNFLAATEAQARQLCFSEDESSNYIPPFKP